MITDWTAKEREHILRLRERVATAENNIAGSGNRRALLNISRPDAMVLLTALNYYYDYLDEEASKP